MGTNLLLALTLVSEGLGGWNAYSKYRLDQLEALRQEGAIVIFRYDSPKPFLALGIDCFAVPTVELYVTPLGNEALIGNSDKPTPNRGTRAKLLAQSAEARSYGAEDIQLIIIGNLDDEWLAFGEANAMSVIEDTKPRYAARLAANQESGTI